jgi:hypothetical protein
MIGIRELVPTPTELLALEVEEVGGILLLHVATDAAVAAETITIASHLLRIIDSLALERAKKGRTIVP